MHGDFGHFHLGESLITALNFIPVLCVLVTCTSTQTSFHPWDSRYSVASSNSAFASHVIICTTVRVNIASSGSNGDVAFGIKSKSIERDLINLLPQYKLHEVVKGTFSLTGF